MSSEEMFSTSQDISTFLDTWLTNKFLTEAKQKVFDNYYASYIAHFGSYIRYHYAQQTIEVLELAKNLESPKLLEVGCGCGTESLYFGLQGIDVTAVDIQDELLGVARERKEIIENQLAKKLPCEFINSSVLELDTTKKYDIIWMEQAFHHLEPREKIIKKLSDLLSPGGYLVFSETSAWNPLIQLFLFRFRGFNTIIKSGDHIWGNERVLTPCGLSRALGKVKLATTSMRYFRTMPNIRLADRLLEIDKAVPQLFFPLFTHYNLVAQKPA